MSYPSRLPRVDISSQRGRESEDCSRVPGDQSGGRVSRDRDQREHRGEQVLQTVHAMQVLEADEAEHREQHESQASVELAAVACNEEDRDSRQNRTDPPFLIRGAVTSGAATATEVSTIAVVYSLVIGSIIYGGIDMKSLYRMLVETAAMSGAILLILGTALSMAWVITQAGVGQSLADFATSLPGGSVSFLMLSIVIFMVLGCVLEGLPALVLMSPLMLPIASDMGLNEIHYAMVVVVSMNIGLMTPPVGIGFYLACRIGNVSPDKAVWAVWLYMFALLGGLLLIAAVPAISTAFL